MRISFDILLILALFMAPFYITCILAFVGLIFFPRFAEFVALALIAELSYRGGDIHVASVAVPLIFIAILCFIVAEFLKAFIRTRMI